jgi:hypothetical protein
MHDYFARLGALVEHAWTEASRDDAAFARIAEEALAKLHPRDHFDREAFLDAELDPALPARRERAPLGAFGQPGVTVHFGREFVIEVYFWVDSLSGVHDHPFSGLFVILEGESVHARYTFEERERAGSRLRFGELKPNGIELLEPGDHRLFGDLSHPLIHSLIHVPVPSISMVIRTIRSRDYWRYLPPSVAVLIEEPDQVIAKHIAFFDSLRRTGDPRYTERLLAYLARCDLETAITLVLGAWPFADEAWRTQVLDVLRARHGSARVGALEPAISRTLRLQQVNTLRQQLAHPDDRLVATALMSAEDRTLLFELLSKRHEDPRARMHRFLDEVGVHVAGDEDSLAAARLLVDGGGREALERFVGDKHGAQELKKQVPQIARFCSESIFAALVA